MENLRKTNSNRFCIQESKDDPIDSDVSIWNFSLYKSPLSRDLTALDPFYRLKMKEMLRILMMVKQTRKIMKMTTLLKRILNPR